MLAVANSAFTPPPREPMVYSESGGGKGRFGPMGSVIMDIVSLFTRLLAAGLASFVVGSVQAQVVVNGDFNAPAIVGAGQTQLVPGDHKMIVTDNSVSNYSASISGIAGWTYALPGWGGQWVGAWSDHGLSFSTGFSNGNGTTAAHINNWERTMSQTLASPLSGNTTVTANFNFGTPVDGGAGRAGTFMLIAGTMDAANPDVLAPGATILSAFTVGNTGWSGLTPNATVATGVWGSYSIAYSVAPDAIVIGQPLTIAFRTLSNSVGSTYWDNISVQIQPIPEPSTGMMLGSGLLLLAVRQSRRRRASTRG